MQPSGFPVPMLTPALPRHMLREAIDYLRTISQSPNLRADVFEALAAQIEAHSSGAWDASRGSGTDGSHIFLGRQGEGLVVAPDGRIYRGAVGRGIGITPSGLQPDYLALIPLD